MPVDFEEVHVTSNADEEDIRNAIMAIRRNRVALKGERGGLSGWGGHLCLGSGRKPLGTRPC